MSFTLQRAEFVRLIKMGPNVEIEEKTVGCGTSLPQGRYHIVWTPKYRYKILKGPVAQDVHNCVHIYCGRLDVRWLS
jgi:Transposase IS200 like